MFYPISPPPQVKRCAIITYKHSIKKLSQELPNEVRLRIRKVSKPNRMIAQCAVSLPK